MVYFLRFVSFAVFWQCMCSLPDRVYRFDVCCKSLDLQGGTRGTPVLRRDEEVVVDGTVNLVVDVDEEEDEEVTEGVTDPKQTARTGRRLLKQMGRMSRQGRRGNVLLSRMVVLT